FDEDARDYEAADNDALAGDEGWGGGGEQHDCDRSPPKPPGAVDSGALEESSSGSESPARTAFPAGRRNAPIKRRPSPNPSKKRRSRHETHLEDSPDDHWSPPGKKRGGAGPPDGGLRSRPTGLRSRPVRSQRGGAWADEGGHRPHSKKMKGTPFTWGKRDGPAAGAAGAGRAGPPRGNAAVSNAAVSNSAVSNGARSHLLAPRRGARDSP
ncbi:hypothetical protein T484DRAFT_1842469, partial [Baffinella frigidus]